MKLTKKFGIMDKHKFGLIAHGSECYEKLSAHVVKMREQDEGYHMGYVYLLEMLATMVYARESGKVEWNQILEVLENVLEITEESGVLQSAATRYKIGEK